MAKETLRQRRHDATYEDLLNAAEIVMVREGFDNVTMRNIAEEAGCSSATLYQYFNDKKELLAEIFGRHVDSLILTIQEQYNNVKDPVEKLRTLVRCILEHFSKNKALGELFRKQLPPKRDGPLEYLPEPYRERFLSFDADILNIFKSVQRTGQIRKDVPAITLRALFMRHLGASHEVLSEDPSLSMEDQFRITWSFLAGGLEIKED